MGLACNNSYRHTTANHLAIGDDVGLNVKPCLGPSLVDAKSENNLIEDQS